MGTTKKGAKTPKRKARLQNQTDKVVEAEITEEKELQYIYPESCEKGKSKEAILKKRKAFRQRVRKTIGRYNRQIAKVETAKANKERGAVTELKRLRKELAAYMKEVYTPGYLDAQGVG